jgi:acetyl esterase/lipase
MALLIRGLFAKMGDQYDELDARAPQDVRVVTDERYGDHSDARLDVYTPARVAEEGGTLPTVVWTHGGGWVGGDKEELGGYFRMIAAQGFTVAGLAYPLAPESRYPTPPQQVMAALAYLQENAARLHVDPSHLLIAGDSAGAQITAQVATIVTSPAFAEKVKISPTIALAQLRGVALCCGPYDLALIRDDSAFKDAFKAILWSYSGTRRYRDDEYFFPTMSVVHHVTEAFPPTFITVGNDDGLAPHSTALAAALRAKAVEVETLFYPPDHVPALGHEYQFKIELDDAQMAFDRLVAFFRRRTQPA